MTGVGVVPTGTGSSIFGSSDEASTSFDNPLQDETAIVQDLYGLPASTAIDLPAGPLPGVAGTPHSAIGYWGYADGFDNGFYDFVSETVDSTPYFNNNNRGFSMLTDSFGSGVAYHQPSMAPGTQNATSDHGMGTGEGGTGAMGISGHGIGAAGRVGAGIGGTALHGPGRRPGSLEPTRTGSSVPTNSTTAVAVPGPWAKSVQAPQPAGKAVPAHRAKGSVVPRRTSQRHRRSQLAGQGKPGSRHHQPKAAWFPAAPAKGTGTPESPAKGNVAPGDPAKDSDAPNSPPPEGGNPVSPATGSGGSGAEAAGSATVGRGSGGNSPPRPDPGTP